MKSDHRRPAPDRPRSFQEDLLADLRQAEPMPAARTIAPRTVIARTLPPSPLPVPAALPVLARATPTTPTTPSIELRLTRQRWSMPGLRPHSDAFGIEFSAGPVRLLLAYHGG